jgi:hypothetical protein
VCYVLLGTPGARFWPRTLPATVVATATELTRGEQSSAMAAMVRRLARTTRRAEGGSCGLQLRHTVALGGLGAAGGRGRRNRAGDAEEGRGSIRATWSSSAPINGARGRDGPW